VPFTPRTFNYNDYKNAWYRTFFLHPNVHSWFFNFHNSCSNIFPIWFYHWWIWLGFAPVVFPPEANEGWEYWTKATSNMEPYMKEVQFFKQFNVAWIFSWEYRLYQLQPAPYPLSLVRIYQVKWWKEYKTKLCGRENVEHFCKTTTKKFTLYNLQHFDKPKLAPPDSHKEEQFVFLH